LKSLTKMECPNCGQRHTAPYPRGLVCDKCGTEKKLKELTDVESGLPKYLYTIAHGGAEAINVVKGLLTAKAHRCVVPGKMVRAASCKDKEGFLTRGGFDNRFRPGDRVTATRPALSAEEDLEVGMRVKVLEGAYAGASGVVYKLIIEKNDEDGVVVDAAASRAPRDKAAALRVARFSGGAAAPVVQKDSAVTYEVKVVFERAALICLCLELGDLATSRGGACMAVRPARPPPSYAATPRASSEATSARGGARQTPEYQGRPGGASGAVAG